jgi:hypothetical protein
VVFTPNKRNINPTPLASTCLSKNMIISDLARAPFSIILGMPTPPHTTKLYIPGPSQKTVPRPDQTALHGVLMIIRDLGLILVEVKYIENDSNL